nr:solute carrier family 40 member 2 [Quercus suber]
MWHTGIDWRPDSSAVKGSVWSLLATSRKRENRRGLETRFRKLRGEREILQTTLRSSFTFHSNPPSPFSARHRNLDIHYHMDMTESLESLPINEGAEISYLSSAHPYDAQESDHFPEAIQDDASHRATCNLLYISHSLSTWNSRAFEFGAFLFLSALYPQTLLPASVYALTRAGRDTSTPFVFLTLLCGLAVIEKLSAILNTISIERDWVIVLAQNNESRLRTLNSRMRRIDLFCKLVGPLAISFLDEYSLRTAIVSTGLMTAVSVGIEYLAIAKVYWAVPALRTSQVTSQTQLSETQVTIWARFHEALSGTITYFHHPAFLPSFALALLYLTVLSFAGQMITFLLSLGISPGALGILRGVAAIFEMSATWLAPKIMANIGAIRAGIWFLNFQLLCVSVACLFFWLDVSPNIAAIGTVCAVIASRIGLWGFDLSAQIIVQEEVEAELRGIFSSQEFAFQNIFEMLSFASTILLPNPNQFKYPAAISTAAVALAGVLYAIFVRARRGHLLHLSHCFERSRKSGRGDGWVRVPGQDDSNDSHELTARP